MEKQTFEKFRGIIYRESGIVLAPEKLSLLMSRIQKRILALGLKDESEYLQIIESDLSGDELVKLIDVVSTNVTHFYREAIHFEMLREILARSTQEGKKEIKIWCAAASSGEEPYTIAFEASEVLDPKTQNLRILATDICTNVLKKAVDGVYPMSGTEKIPGPIRSKYMESCRDNGPPTLRVKPQIAQHILFKRLNLVQFPYSLKGPFDIIFCRNVMIYFDVPTRARIVNEFSRLLSPGGYLFLSLSESLLGIEHDFHKVHSSVFQKE